MPKKAPKADTSEEGFLRAAWDTLGDVCLNFGVQVGYRVLPTARRGVFLLRIDAYRSLPNSSPRKAATWAQEFPCAQTQSFGGAFFRAANQLDALLSSQEAQEKRARSEMKP
jgi:hypothetical protein